MAVIVGAPHVQQFNANIQEVDRLATIYAGISQRDLKLKAAVLHKSAIVLLCACWEAFVEDLAAAAVSELVDRVEDPAFIPTSLQANIGTLLQRQKDLRGYWRLAGKGWRDLLKENCRNAAQSFHNPKADQIDDLFRQTLGIETVSESWKWAGVSPTKARSRLQSLVELRGGIAHRVDAGAEVTRPRVAVASEFIHRLATCTHNRVHQHLRGITRGEVWPRYRYGSAGQSEFNFMSGRRPRASGASRTRRPGSGPGS